MIYRKWILPPLFSYFRNRFTVYPVKYVHGFVVICFVVITFTVFGDLIWHDYPSSPGFRVIVLALGQSYDCAHDDVMKWIRFPRYWPFVRGIHWSPLNSPHKGQHTWRGALMFSLICAWTNGWVNNGDAGDLRRHRAHYDGVVMFLDTHMARVVVICFVVVTFTVFGDFIWHDYPSSPGFRVIVLALGQSYDCPHDGQFLRKAAPGSTGLSHNSRCAHWVIFRWPIGAARRPRK